MNFQQLRFVISDTAYEALSENLEAAGALALTVTDAADDPLYEPELGSFPLWKKTEVIALFSEAVDVLSLAKQLGIENFSIDTVENKAWERVCKDQFHPMCFGEKLWICPSWEVKHPPAAVSVILDPGLAFGTGTHPTTKLCLDWLAANDVKNKIVVDYGCGSGILGIAALKLGAAVVYAVDHDPQALQATLENAAKNNVSALQALTPEQLPQIQADIVIANILANPLIHLSSRLLSLLSKNGRLILSGILPEQIAQVQLPYMQAGVVFDLPMFEEGWVKLNGVREKKIKHTLAECIQIALESYLKNLGDQCPSNIYAMVITETEKAILKTVLDYTENRQSLAAKYLGISRVTLRKKLKTYDLYNSD